jgi:hypothetical protein
MPGSLAYPGSEPFSDNSEAWELLSRSSCQSSDRKGPAASSTDSSNSMPDHPKQEPTPDEALRGTLLTAGRPADHACAW